MADSSVTRVDQVSFDRRIPSLDIVGHAEALDAQQLTRVLRLSATQFPKALHQLKRQVDAINTQMPTTKLPRRLVATLMQPGGTAAQRLSVEVLVPGTDEAVAHTISTTDGVVSFRLPAGAGLRSGEHVTLLVRGAQESAEIHLSAKQIGVAGIVGAVKLPHAISPLPVSIIASLEKLLADEPAEKDEPPPAPVSDKPVVKLGEGGDVCSRLFGSDAAEDKFTFGVLFRLVEPRTSVLTQAVRYGTGANSFAIAARSMKWLAPTGEAKTVYVDRVPVDQPISVDGFRDQIIGLGGNDVIQATETVPMAGTLGLGYVVEMAQRWTPLGVTLGDLVYSLPLAPGEQQRIAIFERREATSVFESETLSDTEAQTFQQSQDTSALATFQQAFNESAKGGSKYSSSAESSSGGFNFIIASGGSGSSSNQGETSSWMEGQRNTTSSAAEDTHAALERSATAKREAQRTSMRLATATESQDVTTKVITNHNHTRALTMQYWQVHRLFDVTTAVDGVTLVCFVPLEVVRFLPPGQHLTLDEAHILTKRSQVLHRYSALLKHADRLERALPRGYLKGLEIVNEFAADPRATVDTDPGNAEDVVKITLHAGVLPNEELFVSAVTRRGTRIGPVQLTGTITPLRDDPGTNGKIDPSKCFTSEAEFLGYLRDRRAEGDVKLEGALTLPASLARGDVVGFEITRMIRPLDRTFVSSSLQAATGGFELAILTALAPDAVDWKTTTKHFTASDLERELGGPSVWSFSAKIEGASETYDNDALSSPVILPTSPYPVPAREVAPVLRYSALLQIEKTLHHVVRNTLHYSQVIWSSLSPIERVILLEGFTIGVTLGGVEDETQDIPLLNCVANKVLGFYGNSMVMPFIIPAGTTVRSQADTTNGTTEITNAQVEDALVRFHKTGFSPPHSRIALPTHGVLGEAILGHCPSAEKIDLTRFWNWQDSPPDSATAINSVTVPTTSPSVAAGLTAPNTLTGMAPLITNFNNQPPIPIDTSLVGQLSAAAQAQKDFTGLTNADQLAGLIKQTQTTAESARADALKRATELQSQAMTEIGNFFGAKGGEAYAANYRDQPGGGSTSGGTSSSSSGSQPSPYQQLVNAKTPPPKKPATKSTTPSKTPATKTPKTPAKPPADGGGDSSSGDV